ncbi:unnamed protein product [Paramecium sonneborni]|uniref:Uncharacterized protein n=1 Tax=Paramecium sonneborni TaxID=65129 RepID=A0A8S1JW54_9CILI|nr:unnamed protein product [Paramecium sonneborni]
MKQVRFSFSSKKPSVMNQIFYAYQYLLFFSNQPCENQKLFQMQKNQMFLLLSKNCTIPQQIRKQINFRQYQIQFKTKKVELDCTNNFKKINDGNMLRKKKFRLTERRASISSQKIIYKPNFHIRIMKFKKPYLLIIYLKCYHIILTIKS